MRKTIAIIGSNGIPARYGGFETLAEQLALKLGDEFSVIITCNSIYSKISLDGFSEHVERIFLNSKPNGIRSIIYDIVSIIKTAYRSDYLLILGCSSAFIFPLIRIIYPHTKIIFHPDGLEWKRPKWNIIAKLFLKCSTKLGAKFAHAVVIDNMALCPFYTKMLKKVQLISYGGDQYNIKEQLNRKNYWLTIARAEPENNLEIIAEFFKDNKTEKWLLITNGKGTKYGQMFIKKYEKSDNITILDSEYNKHKIANYFAECKGYIHGHSIGGTNPSLVAAMWNKFPIICHDNIFNRTTTNNYALFFRNTDDLKNKIIIANELNSKPFEDLYSFAKNENSWQKIILQYKQLFNSI